MNVQYILVLVLILLVLVGLSHYSKSRTIFTCTTFFDFEKQDRWASFQRAITNIYRYNSSNLPQKWFIVNEYSATPKADWAALMAERYPQMIFIQKQKDQKGQAKSLNLILEAIKPYDYWIQWEDSWYPERPFLARAIDIMNSSTISQLQITTNRTKVSWLDVSAERKKHLFTSNGTEYIQILPSSELTHYLKRHPKDYDTSWNKLGWPLFSLQPSVNRVSHIRSLGEFSTDAALWPVKFEWAWARQWFLAGGTKAVLPDGPVIRSGHISTYAK
jgi:hypothetical protein